MLLGFVSLTNPLMLRWPGTVDVAGRRASAESFRTPPNHLSVNRLAAGSRGHRVPADATTSMALAAVAVALPDGDRLGGRVHTPRMAGVKEGSGGRA